VQVLTMETRSPSLRAEVEAWGREDSTLVVPDKPIGFTLSPMGPHYLTVLHAMADGWKLLAAPIKYGTISKLYIWEWWLTKE
jgi:hypothetical protein